jgi:ankyrin repeat protein
MSVASQANREAQKAVLDAVKAKYSGDELLNHISLYSHSGGSAVMFAAAAGNVELAQDLLDIGGDLSAVARAKPEYLEKIKKAVEDGTYTGAEPHVDGLTGLHVAVQGGHTKMVELILKLPNIDISHKDDLGRTPLLLAIKSNVGEMASMLVQAGADPNTQYTDDDGVAHNLLFDSIMVENVKFAKSLIDAGADIYYKDEKGVTTLLQACHRGLTEVAQLLVDKHKASGKDAAFLDAASDEGISPLIAASSEGHLDVVKLLITAGANVDGKDQDETTALMAASARGHVGAVKELLAAGAKVNEQNRDGHTALMFAYNGKNQVETLWERFNLFKAEQADKFSDDGGSGPLLRDALSNHTALVDILLKSGADTKLKDKEGHVAKDFDYHPDADSEILDKVVKKEASKEESRDEL